MKRHITNDVVIVLAGEAGQGIQSIESILSLILKRSGYHFFSASEFMSRVRGGSNSTEIRVSSRRVRAFCDRIDILIPLHAEGLDRLAGRISGETLILGERDIIGRDGMTDVPFSKIAAEAGSALFSNTVAAGCICGIMRVDAAACEPLIDEYFSAKTEDVREKNKVAFRAGYERGAALDGLAVEIESGDGPKGELMLSGADAVALGALAGGCDYVCGYPMSPATSALEKMAAFSKRHDIIVEQVEDEVGVINMALGAWYAGARAFISTSGGGFALMTEGVSLAGMIESPLVLHLAQRPGPATGLPTRTEQGDLDLVLYAGHGDFPRVIYAPGTLTQGYELTRKAFDVADRFQVPAFVLTDQYFVDTRYNTPLFDVQPSPSTRHIVKTEAAYNRFALTDSGVSPRGIPGYGAGVVCADSDEHDESGHITEDLDLRVRMVDKRKKKLEALVREALPPDLTGSERYTKLVVCWGSTLPIVEEALLELNDPDVALLHFSQVYPLAPGVREILERARVIVCVENNSSAQFARLLALETGVRIDRTVLKYSGLPFSVEELLDSLGRQLRDVNPGDGTGEKRHG